MTMLTQPGCGRISGANIISKAPCTMKIAPSVSVRAISPARGWKIITTPEAISKRAGSERSQQNRHRASGFILFDAVQLTNIKVWKTLLHVRASRRGFVTRLGRQTQLC